MGEDWPILHTSHIHPVFNSPNSLIVVEPYFPSAQQTLLCKRMGSVMYHKGISEGCIHFNTQTESGALPGHMEMRAHPCAYPVVI